MGANAQIAVPAFTAGQILTAAQQTQINTGIPVFAGTTEREAAFGGTGEKTLAEGQYAYLESTDATQVYDGANWVSVGTTPGLVCVKATTTFSAVTQILADSVFTTTYESYLILMEGVTSASDTIQIQYRTGGTTDTSATYNYQFIYGASTSVVGARGTSQNSTWAGDFGTSRSAATITIQTPATATPTTSLHQTNRNGDFVYISCGNFTGSTAFDGIRLSTVGGSNLTGQYTIYAYSKTV